MKISPSPRKLSKVRLRSVSLTLKMQKNPSQTIKKWWSSLWMSMTILSLRGDGEIFMIFVDDKPTNLEALSTVVKQTDPKTLIDLKSDKSSRFETFISIMDILKEHNHENFSISTQAQ